MSVVLVFVAICCSVATSAGPHFLHNNVEFRGLQSNLPIGTLANGNVTIVICGFVGAGKSSLIERLVGLPKGKISADSFDAVTTEAASYHTSQSGFAAYLNIIDTPGFGEQSQDGKDMMTIQATNGNLLAQGLGRVKRLYYVVDPTARGGIAFVDALRLLAQIYGSVIARAVRFIVNKCDRINQAKIDAANARIAAEYQLTFDVALPPQRILLVSAEQCMVQLVHDIWQAGRDPDLDLSNSRSIFVRPRPPFNIFRTSNDGLCVGLGHEFPAGGLSAQVAVSLHGAIGSGKSRLIEQLTGQARGSISAVSGIGARTREVQINLAIPRLTLIDGPGFGETERPQRLRVLQQLSRAMKFAKGDSSFKRIYYVVDGTSRVFPKGRLEILKLIYGKEAAHRMRFIVNKCDQIEQQADPDAIRNDLATLIRTEYAAVFSQALSPDQILYTSAEQCIVQLVQDLCHAANDQPLVFHNPGHDDSPQDINDYLANLNKKVEHNEGAIKACREEIDRKNTQARNAVITEWAFAGAGIGASIGKVALKAHKAHQMWQKGQGLFKLAKMAYKTQAGVRHLGKLSATTTVIATAAYTVSSVAKMDVAELGKSIEDHQEMLRADKEHIDQVHNWVG